MDLVIVESPAKAKTINKYLGSNYKVLASYGHIKDLPSKDGSVLPDEDFRMIYELSDKSTKHVKEITEAAKKSDRILLATDPDREGEAISWHIVETLREKKAIKDISIAKRVVFNEITKKAVIDGVNNPREIDMNLVNAQQARRALDYLVGFNLSPVLWRKLPGSKSAGRVQSVALRLICEREHEIEAFRTQEYWTVKGFFVNEKSDIFAANLTHLEGKKLDKFDIGNESQAMQIKEDLANKSYSIASIEKREVRRSPQPPFTTSSLQQEASRKLGFSAKKTMQFAQKLYEGIDLGGETVGLITYMRTDGVQVSQEALTTCRKLIGNNFGDNYLPKEARIYKTKAKNAQEAHEAIRPTNIELSPDKVKANLDNDQYRLYELIWKRMVASQMEQAIFDQMVVEIVEAQKYANFRAVGTTLKFDGFYKLYREGKDDEEEEEEAKLPSLKELEKLAVKEIKPAQHFTEAPPRYSEASLVKKLEELGIGRPSTYASIISVLQERDYVRLDKKRFIPEERGLIVTTFLSHFFGKYVQYDFTAKLEEELDQVSNGDIQWKQVLRKFWDDFYNNIGEVKQIENIEIIKKLEESLAQHIFGDNGKKCPKCETGELGLKLGKFGAFLGCTNYPECGYTKQLQTGESDMSDANAHQDGILGNDPKTGQPVYLKKGPYGYYVQIGENIKGDKPKRASVPSPEISLEKALGYLSLPREVGNHPETGKMISAGIGKFGPYLLHDGKYKSIKSEEDLLTIGINRAVDMLAETKASSGVIKAFSDDLSLCNGRYGVYLKYKGKNVKIPRGVNQDELTLESALKIVENQ